MIRSDFFYIYDYDAIAAHLEKMAARGWLIEKIGPFFWKYRKIEPQKLKFHVSYYAVTSGFDPEPTSKEGELAALCGRSGWRLAARTPRIQILCTSDPNPAPVVTDPEPELAVIHRGAMRGEVPFAAAALMMSVYMLAGLIFGGAAFCGLPALSRGFMTGLQALVAAYYALELAAYPIWYLRARRAALSGEWAPSVRISPAVRTLQWLAFFGLLAWGVSAAALAAGAERLAGLAAPVLAAALFSGVDALRQRLRARGLSARRNRTLTALTGAAAFSLAAALFGIVQ